MEFILDTNAYRNLARVGAEDVNRLVAELKLGQQRHKATSALSIVVAMELMQHLLKGDPDQEVCYHALRLQFSHTTYYDIDEGRASFNYYPPMNILLAQHYFGKNSKFIELYASVMQLIVSLTKSNNINGCGKYSREITIVRNQLDFEQNQIRENFEVFLKGINAGQLDWDYFRHNKQERKRWFANIKSGKMHELIGLAFLRRAYQVMDETELSGDVEEKFDMFMKQYRAAINMSIVLISSLGNSVNALADPADSRWNTVHDTEILFALLFKRQNEGEKILVTDDRKIKEACESAGVGDQVMKLDEYLNLVQVSL